MDIATLAASLTRVYEEMLADVRAPWPDEGTGSLPAGPAAWKHNIRHVVQAVVPGMRAGQLRMALLSPNDIVERGGPRAAAVLVTARVYGVDASAIRTCRDRARRSAPRSFDGRSLDTSYELLAVVFRALGCEPSLARASATLATTVASALLDVDPEDRTQVLTETIVALYGTSLPLRGSAINALADAADAGLPDDVPNAQRAPHDWPWFAEWLKTAPIRRPVRTKDGEVARRRPPNDDPRPEPPTRAPAHRVERRREGSNAKRRKGPVGR